MKKNKPKKKKYEGMTKKELLVLTTTIYKEGQMAMLKACGGCDICYGKGYSTQMLPRGRILQPCGCERGRQIAGMMIKGKIR